jgi:shikimate kinase
MNTSGQQSHFQIFPGNKMDFSKNNIALIGFMGTGKTSVGRLLAAKCEHVFVDIDEHIAKKTGMDIPSIFSKYGELYFRNLEQESLAEFLLKENQVISCGGGIVLTEINRKLLKKNAVNCWLYNSVEKSISRINQTGRPLLNASDPIEKARDLFREREALYLDVAHFGICTDYLDQPQIADILCKNIFRELVTRR